MKNIHLFETENAYDAAKSGLILPRVSYIKESQDVKYNPTFDANGHEFVEIAGIKWATMNVGASGVTDCGKYFQWGDITGYTADQVGTGEDKKKFAYDWSDYKWYDKENSTSYIPRFTKYSGDGKTVLELEDDPVHAAWGGSWRMPTWDEFRTFDKFDPAVIGDWTDDYQGSKVAGWVFTKTDTSKTLFFPACGAAVDGSVSDVSDFGHYWSSSLISNNVNYVANAYCWIFKDGYLPAYENNSSRFNGLCVRGVLDEI